MSILEGIHITVEPNKVSSLILPRSLRLALWAQGVGALRQPLLIAPELKKKSISLKIPAWLNEWLDQQSESKVSLIEKALFAQYHLTPPIIKPDWFNGLSVRNIDGLTRLGLFSLPKVKKLVNDPSFSFGTDSNMGEKSKREIKIHIDNL